MGQALYRKYRSKSLKDVVGQEHVTRTLEQALNQQQISHAYLFTGPRGVGKTSVARILAHEINDLPYTDDKADIDIIEIDAASNRRIDEIRELRDKVYIAPTSAKYKVYIIDEVHMLTREAFNALLKTLEEPPQHVVFILATTDAHKLPETIVSRTQRFHFKPAEPKDLIALLQKISKEEKISITPEAVTLLAEHSDGSFRDALSLLDQARSHAKAVDVKTITELLGLPPAEALKTLLATLQSGDAAKLVRLLSELYTQGFQATTIAKQLGQLLREDIVNHPSGHDQFGKLELLGKLVEVPPAYDPERFLEIILLQAVSVHAAPSIEAARLEPAAEAPEEPLSQPTKATAPAKPGKPISNEDLWPAVLQSLKQKHNTLYGIVRMAKPNFPDENTLQLTFSFAFHQKKLNETSNRQLLLDTIDQLSGRQLIIECLLDSNGSAPQQTVQQTAAPPDSGFSTINNIFSGAELLES
ncbi:MAG TPA: DNA polymerase III subunit gamma/tau [Candidatus Dormibacteraeota bacterium]|nr:DNA polymerase III subunit gamma/tau [Candidatus Dormibacteraeota bacterium]